MAADVLPALDSPKVEWALACAALGLRVHPLHWIERGVCSCGKACDRSAGKHPMLRGWQTSASTETEAIRRWWLRYPLANIGIATGEGSGVCVLDADGLVGRASLAGFNLPETLTVETGSGGLHVYFRHPEIDGLTVANTVSRLAPKLDVRTERGNLVGPGSVNAAGQYRVVRMAPVAHMPAHLIERLQALAEEVDEPESVPRVYLVHDDTVPEGDRERRARAYARKIEPAISGAGGHTSAFIAAEKIVRGFDLPEDVAFRVLRDEYNPACQPPWSDRDLRRKVREAAVKGRFRWGSLVQDRVQDRREPVSGVHYQVPHPAGHPAGQTSQTGSGAANTNIPLDESGTHARVIAELAPELPFDEIWTPEPDAKLVIPALGIAPGPPHLITGSWYTGKTLVLATMGLSVASGKSLFGVWQTRRGRWIHFDHEMGRRHLKRYIQRLARGMGLEPDDLRDMMSLRVLPRLNLCTANAIDYYCEILKDYAFATFDPLRAAAPGRDENKSEFREYLDILGHVSDRTNCAVAVLHHGGKPTDGAERRNTGRGSSAIDDAVQTKFVLTTKEKGAPMLVTHEKTRELTQLLQDFYLSVDNSAPGAVRLVHLEPEQVAAQTEDSEKAKLRIDAEVGVAAIEEFFRSKRGEFAGSVDDIRKLIPKKDIVVQRGWAELRAAGRLIRDGGKFNPKWKLL